MIDTNYLYEDPDWPEFRWSQEELSSSLEEVWDRKIQLLGRMSFLGFNRQREAVLDTITGDVLKSSEIEGEILDASQVRSSVAQRLGLDIGGLKFIGRDVEGIVDLMLDATQNFEQPLTDERLFGWHAALFPTGRAGRTPITVGGWRDDSYGRMQVVSGPIGGERVHYVAPMAGRVEDEMKYFLDWFNSPSDTDPLLQAGLAHLWFVTIHPFDDGNGRIARAIADMALSRSDGNPQRFYSMSSQIREERRDYYEMLEKTQKGGLDVTEWMHWFVGCLGRAIGSAENTLDATLAKARFLERIAEIPVNERQNKIISMLLDGFRGKLTLPKYAKINKCSLEVAFADIDEMISHGILAQSDERGRNPGYSLVNAGVIHQHSTSRRRRSYRSAPRGGARHRRRCTARRHPAY